MKNDISIAQPEMKTKLTKMKGEPVHGDDNELEFQSKREKGRFVRKRMTTKWELAVTKRSLQVRCDARCGAVRTTGSGTLNVDEHRVGSATVGTRCLKVVVARRGGHGNGSSAASVRHDAADGSASSPPVICIVATAGFYDHVDGSLSSGKECGGGDEARAKE